jgi:hypothetical protein
MRYLKEITKKTPQHGKYPEVFRAFRRSFPGLIGTLEKQVQFLPGPTYDIQLIIWNGEKEPTLKEFSKKYAPPALIKYANDYYVYGLTKEGKKQLLKIEIPVNEHDIQRAKKEGKNETQAKAVAQKKFLQQEGIDFKGKTKANIFTSFPLHKEIKKAHYYRSADQDKAVEEIFKAVCRFADTYFTKIMQNNVYSVRLLEQISVPTETELKRSGITPPALIKHHDYYVYGISKSGESQVVKLGPTEAEIKESGRENDKQKFKEMFTQHLRQAGITFEQQTARISTALPIHKSIRQGHYHQSFDQQDFIKEIQDKFSQHLGKITPKIVHALKILKEAVTTYIELRAREIPDSSEHDLSSLDLCLEELSKLKIQTVAQLIEQLRKLDLQKIQQIQTVGGVTSLDDLFKKDQEDFPKTKGESKSQSNVKDEYDRLITSLLKLNQSKKLAELEFELLGLTNQEFLLKCLSQILRPKMTLDGEQGLRFGKAVSAAIDFIINLKPENKDERQRYEKLLQEKMNEWSPEKTDEKVESIKVSEEGVNARVWGFLQTKTDRPLKSFARQYKIQKLFEFLEGSSTEKDVLDSPFKYAKLFVQLLNDEEPDPKRFLNTPVFMSWWMTLGWTFERYESLRTFNNVVQDALGKIENQRPSSNAKIKWLQNQQKFLDFLIGISPVSIISEAELEPYTAKLERIYPPDKISYIDAQMEALISDKPTSRKNRPFFSAVKGMRKRHFPLKNQGQHNETQVSNRVRFQYFWHAAFVPMTAVSLAINIVEESTKDVEVSESVKQFSILLAIIANLLFRPQTFSDKYFRGRHKSSLITIHLMLWFFLAVSLGPLVISAKSISFLQFMGLSAEQQSSALFVLSYMLVRQLGYVFAYSGLQNKKIEAAVDSVHTVWPKGSGDIYRGGELSPTSSTSDPQVPDPADFEHVQALEPAPPSNGNDERQSTTTLHVPKSPILLSLSQE